MRLLTQGVLAGVILATLFPLAQNHTDRRVEEVNLPQQPVSRVEQASNTPGPILVHPQRRKAPVHHHRYVKHIAVSLSAEQWAASADAHLVTGCEAPDGPTEIDRHRGVWYFGLWQMDAEFVHDWGHVDPWRYVMHGQFMMPEHEQNEIAYRGWKVRGWQPWTCARRYGLT